MIKYLLSIGIVTLLSLIYLLSFKLNKKIEIKCEKKTCFGCDFSGCIHRKEEE